VNLKFKTTTLFFLLILALPLQAQEFPHGDGKLRLYNYHLDEWAEIQFRDHGKLIPEGVDQINHLLRSRDNATIINMDPKLLDLVDFLQDHFGADTVEVISGFRSKELNQGLLNTGHNVSPVSFHTQGKAMDIHLDEIREETLRDFALSLRLGGVGYYGPLDFVHVDTGPVRHWEEPLGARKLVGVLDPKSPFQLTSNKNDYLPGDQPHLVWSLQGNAAMNQVEGLQVERFWRGKWIPCHAYLYHEKDFTLNPSSIQCKNPDPLPPYGKYRLTFHLIASENLLSSNEFYLKKE
jgi:uncharacterized protein YcbK (DUF882 family)